MIRLELQEIQAARERISPFIVTTPLLPVSEGRLWLKAENLQATGSFKVRGAASHLTRLPPGQGVVTASSGNHGQAVAYVARRMGRRAVVVVPEDIPQVKADRIVQQGGQLIRRGRTSQDRMDEAERLAREEGLVLVPSYDDLMVMAGQGTIALEILEQRPDVGTVLVPVSGGGLISGIAAGLKAGRSGIEVIGVEPEDVPRFAQSRAAGRRVSLPFAPTIADGLRVVEPGRMTWDVAGTLVDRFVAVSDAAILSSVRDLAVGARLVVEPSGAAAFAAAQSLSLSEPTVVVLSGGNVEPSLLASILKG